MHLANRFRCLGLMAALPLVSLLTGCGASHARFTPTSDEARSSLEAALTAWRDGKPYGPVEATPPVQVADSAWQAGQQVESFEIGEEQDEGDGDQAVRRRAQDEEAAGRPVRPLFRPRPRPGLGLPRRGLQADDQHGQQPRAGFQLEVRSSAIGQAAMTRIAPGSERDHREQLSGDGADLAARWLRAQARPGPAPDPDRARGRGTRGRPLGVDTQLLGPADPGHPYGKHRAPRRLGRYRVFLPDGPRRGLRLAGAVRDLQHGPGTAQAGRGPRACPTASWRACSFRPTGFNWREFRRPPRRFSPLVREFESSGLVARTADAATVLLEIPARQAPWIAEGQTADVTCADLPGHDSMAGRVQAVERRSSDGWEYLRTTIAVTDPPRDLRAGMIAVVRITIPMAALEPFRSLPSDPPRLSAGEPRIVYACPDHPENLTVDAGRCPIDRKQQDPRPLSDFQRVRWWCPMHPSVTADRPGEVCKACGGMVLKPRVISYAPAGQVLTVPASAVVDAGGARSSSSRTCPGCLTASRSSSARAAVMITRSCGASKWASASRSPARFCSTPRRA